jgi:putative oxidoreductase
MPTWTSFGRFQDLGLLILRVGVGLIFLLIHGLPRLLDPASWAHTGRAVIYLGIDFGHQAWGFLATVAMTLGAVCVILGWAHRPAALALTVTMGVASIWRFYPFGGWDSAAYPVMTTIVCLALLLTGPGKISLQGK